MHLVKRCFTHINRKITHNNLIMFAMEICRSPKSTGAICPSSKHLAQQMAQQVNTENDGLVIELGGGTGVITHALLEHGVPPERLVVIEYSPTFARHLQSLFPAVKVIQGDACSLQNLLPPEVKINAIVSSLPLISLPSSSTHCIIEQWRTLLAKQGIAVQFTYNVKASIWRQLFEYAKTTKHRIWFNIPPAVILVFNFKNK